MIKFYCTSCDKKLGVPYEYAGKNVKCPRCKRPIQVPHPEPEVDDVEIIEDIENDSIYSVSNSSTPKQTQAQQDDNQPPEKCPKCKFKLNGNYCFNCSYVYSPPKEKIQPIVEDQGSKIGKLSKDLTRYLVPVRSMGDGVMVFILVILTVYSALPTYGIFMLISQLCVRGMVCAIFFNIILETANGNDDLPSLSEIPDMWGGFLRPLLMFFASVIYAFVPGIILSFAYASLASTFSNDENIATLILCCPILLFAVGLFLWPMIILTMALNDGFIVRPDYVFKSIIRMIGPYILCCICLYVAVFVCTWALEATKDKSDDFLVIAIIAQVGSLLVQIYSMRAIGLLYRHYQDRLEW